MTKAIEFLVKLMIYACFFVPLIVLADSFIFPFIVPKIVVFRSVVEIMLGGYVILLLLDWRRYRPQLSVFNVILGIFLLSFVISTFAGVDWYHSFWDNHERMLGLFTILHYAILYLVATSVFGNWKEWRLALRIFLIAGSLVMMVGIAQVFDPYLLLNQGGNRVASTLGNPIYVGGYGLFLFFASILLLMREKYGWWAWLEVLMGLLGLLGMFFSGTRGVMLGLLVGLVSMLVMYIFVLKDKPKIKRSLYAVLFLILILLTLIYSFRHTKFINQLPAVGRAINTSWSDVKATPRWLAWQIAITSAKERPVFGWGPNNFFYAFNKYYNPKSLEYGIGETWFDNSHNIILNTLTVQGMFGLLAYLAIFAMGGYWVLLSYKKDGLNRNLAVVGVSFLIAHLISNITVFENPTSYLYFVFWLAFLNQQIARRKSNILMAGENKKSGQPAMLEETSSNLTMINFISGAILIMVLASIYFFNIRVAQANNNTLQAIRMIGTSNISSTDYMKKALEVPSPHIDDIRADIARQISIGFNTLYQNLGQSRAEEILDLSYLHLKLNSELHPLDIRNQMTLSQLARIKAVLNQDANEMLKAEYYLKDALQKSPKRQQIMFSLATIEESMGKNDEAEVLYKQAIDENKNIAESYWRLAYFYGHTGHLDKARQTVDLAKTNGVIFNANDQSIIDSIFASSTVSVSTSVK
ncbi:MAG: hypothetical protein COU31_00415 [Candidatus Magasanikbacteria bacterium CG10_big_fil_rev_8_21_14_0_10_40_10]|uniref:O-antigen ligase-related domain-containing protein n=1 Tax=Candidatus Magasanikbacteria bacterium CG10_big_fil_rev_8_21_14_0_10_40_10 TaxID=1974648 RepID=A0A2M6W574_9BACT|nr:MAG: hypothetical protein COU31_00415 [Candidatus Magasanikbacteria bacterium CG10_big_fil_rev_8_21_14_0_10_40_10]